MNVNYFNKMSRNRYETMIYYCLHVVETDKVIMPTSNILNVDTSLVHQSRSEQLFSFDKVLVFRASNGLTVKDEHRMDVQKEK